MQAKMTSNLARLAGVDRPRRLVEGLLLVKLLLVVGKAQVIGQAGGREDARVVLHGCACIVGAWAGQASCRWVTGSIVSGTTVCGLRGGRTQSTVSYFLPLSLVPIKRLLERGLLRKLT